MVDPEQNKRDSAEALSTRLSRDSTTERSSLLLRESRESTAEASPRPVSKRMKPVKRGIDWSLAALTAVGCVLTLGIAATGVGAVVVGAVVVGIGVGILAYQGVEAYRSSQAAKQSNAKNTKADTIDETIEKTSNAGLVVGVVLAVAAIMFPPLGFAAGVIGAIIAGGSLLAKMANSYRKRQNKRQSRRVNQPIVSQQNPAEQPHIGENEAQVMSELRLSEKQIEDGGAYEEQSAEHQDQADTQRQLDKRGAKPFHPDESYQESADDGPEINPAPEQDSEPHFKK